MNRSAARVASTLLAAISCGATAATSASSEPTEVVLVLELDPSDTASVSSHVQPALARVGASALTAPSCSEREDLACLRIARPVPSRLRIALSDRARTARAERTVALGRQGLDAVHLEELGQIVETSVLALRTAPSRPGALPAPRPLAGGGGFSLDLGYELGNWGSNVWIGGPRAGVRYTWPASALQFGISSSVWTGLPIEQSGTGATVDFWPSALRIQGFGELSVVRNVRLELALGVGAELLRANSKTRADSLRSEPAVTRVHSTFRAAVATRWSIFASVSLRVEPYLELAPAEVQLGVQHPEAFEPVLTLRGVRLGGALALCVEL